MKTRRQGFLKGAAILMGAVAIVKLLGAFFKIPLSWILTPVGMSYFGSAYSLYFPIYSLSAAGFPVAISHLVSECCAKGRFRDVRIIHQISVKLFLCVGLFGFTLMLFLAPPYAQLSSAGQARSLLPAIWALAPSIFFCSMISVYRGFYEGLRDMVPTAVSQILEALCRLIFGLAFSIKAVQIAAQEYAVSKTVWGVPQPTEEYARLAALPMAAAGAIFGVTIGSVVSFFYLWCHYRKTGDGITQQQITASPKASEPKLLLKNLWHMALPVALGSLAVNLSTLADAAWLNAGLRILMGKNAASLLTQYAGELPTEVIRLGEVPSYLYGCFTNATTLFLLIPTLTQALGISALPNVTAAWAAGSKKQITDSLKMVFSVAALLAIPAGLGMSFLAKPICAFLYGPQNAPGITGKILFYLGFAAIFSALGTSVNSLLQAVGRADIPVKILGVGLLVKVIMNWVLVPMPQWNVLGAAFSTLLSYFVILVLGLHFLRKVTGVQMQMFSLLWKPILGGTCCVAVALTTEKILSGYFHIAVAVLAAVLAAVVIYLLICAVLHAIPHEVAKKRRFREKKKDCT
ncbi:MAG: polysaccharide biosynthesis protein [Clostridiales bacterium]|jgi:stage V sporulation protein B|nr:polysaccharide biosynthesis protein [Clostridiales bacterium]MCI2160655.1 polysaccharide biosynthesis protein [Oscillospiraceae bacterium]MCI1960885.1 polysaccharide biosynthesis protein [Clostridiales bacterium]MCI2021326.1 polysaccharide biosynthesis protein [Clostridiales bacterium]MCI2025709.1 polysaccharide biosynthesis protein [Clostridiales bacterium]